MLRQAVHKSLLWFVAVILIPITLQARVVDRLIVVIDGEPYTLSNLEAYAKTKLGRDFPTGDLNQINPSDREVLEQFITEKLLAAEIRDAGIKVTDEEVDHYIEQIKKRNNLSNEDLRTVLSREGQTMASYRESVKSQLEQNEIVNRQVRKRVNITAEDVERYYKLNSKNYRSDDRVRLRHIMLALSERASPDEVQIVMAKAENLYKRIMAGEDFAQLAQEFSEGAGSGSGGYIGWVNRGALLKPIADVAFNKLSVGEVSEPVRSSIGVHLVKLEGRENGTVLPLTTVGPKIKEELSAKALEERFARWLKGDLRRKHRVDVKLTGVVFKPEDSTDGTVGSLMARSTRLSRKTDRSLLSYLNPFSYVVKETPFEDEDPKSPFAGKSVVSVLGIPLFTTDSADDVPDLLSKPVDKSPEGGATSGQSGGFFSSILDSLNPFKR